MLRHALKLYTFQQLLVVECSDNYSAGWKYSHWEQKGVPIRLEIGPRDVEKGTVSSVRRDTGAREDLRMEMDTIAESVRRVLDAIQVDMLEKARRERDERISIVTEWKDFIPALDKAHMVLTPWSQDIESEEWVKEQTKASGAADIAPGAAGTGGEAAKDAGESGSIKLSGAAKTLCIPFEQPPMPEGQLCFTGSGKKATAWTLWGRSY